MTATVSKPQLDAALRKAAAVWVQPQGHPSRLVWGVWFARPPLAGSLLVATGGTEQQVPGLVDGAEVQVVVAAPGSRSRLAEISCTARRIEPDAAAATALRTARRNGAAHWHEVFQLQLA
ncbi:hypothetical protein [Rhodococcus sp. X156]|uniref:hypothetical protein n=1 Tax=Rhodococcus sp. X156 TaxID=2499145 RepID=UPI000FDA067A|nr:hypothetical protein [Rhodococcus sp. X156]